MFSFILCPHDANQILILKSAVNHSFISCSLEIKLLNEFKPSSSKSSAPHCIYTSNANDAARAYSVLSNLRIIVIAFIINLPGKLLLISGYGIEI